MDGTTVESESIWHETSQRVVEHYGVAVNDTVRQQITKISGLGIKQTCEVLNELFGLDKSLENIIEKKIHIGLGLLREKVQYMPGFIEFHHGVKQRGLKTALATNADNAILAVIQQAVNLQEHFAHHMYTISHVGDRCKPDPAVYLYAAKQIETDPQHCIAIEDSKSGIDAAKNAGMYCIGLNSSGNLDGNNCHADAIVNTYEEINLEELLGIK